MLRSELQGRLGSFDVYAERLSAFLPVFKQYPSFKELLVYLAQGQCDGCREGTCLYPTVEWLPLIKRGVLSSAFSETSSPVTGPTSTSI